MRKDLLLEIGTEELPSSCMIEGLKNIKNLISEGLSANNIEFEDIVTLATPRRIIAYVKNAGEQQKSVEKTAMGPPLKIAYENGGGYSQAATGFAKSLGIDASELKEIDTPRGKYMGYSFTEEPKKSVLLLPEILKQAILSLSFSKQMTWGDYSIKFARPIRWIAALFGNEIIKFEIENISSSNKTRSHRMTGNIELEISGIEKLQDYIDFLENKASVIAEPQKRRQKILDQIDEIEKNQWAQNYRAVLDQDLIEEVVNLVETPNVLTGRFPEQYLYIPKEILIKAIQHHQRYFAVLDINGNISTTFITIQNGNCDRSGAIIKGNERVLKARLSDAKFFYEEDKKHSFEIWLEKLKGVVFYSKIGTLYDKASRLEKISSKIIEMLQNSGYIFDNSEQLYKDTKRAARLCKCDLVTNLAVEFPELQGLVGSEYAKEMGEATNVVDALFEHYLPRFAQDILPSSDTGAITSISDKIDTIAGIFLAGNIPSGSEDPFALRRKASGIILTALKKNYNIDIAGLAEFAAGLYLENFDLTNIDVKGKIREITEFIFARYRFNLEKEQKRTDVFDAIRNAGFNSIIDISLKYDALIKYIEEGNDISFLSDPLIRCSNIIKGKSFSQVEKKYLAQKHEIILYNELISRENQLQKIISKKEFSSALEVLCGFSEYVNDFFDNVLVMDKDNNLKNNRINLIKRCLDMYLLYADFSKLLQQ
ncbi:MAG: glycine--tRNA ligase subunit beta [Actinobacteria bacterium]|nr:glycine--tRNA ligase subunit beta [Actinomycetota bacterium]